MVVFYRKQEGKKVFSYLGYIFSFRNFKPVYIYLHNSVPI